MSRFLVATQELFLGSREVDGYTDISSRSVSGHLSPPRCLADLRLAAAGGVAPAASRDPETNLRVADDRLGIQAALRYLSPFPFERIFTSTGANSFYTVTTHYFASTVGPTSIGCASISAARAEQHAREADAALRAPVPDEGTRRLPWLVVAVSNLGAVLILLRQGPVLRRQAHGDDRRGPTCSSRKAAFFPLRTPSRPWSPPRAPVC